MPYQEKRSGLWVGARYTFQWNGEMLNGRLVRVGGKELWATIRTADGTEYKMASQDVGLPVTDENAMVWDAFGDGSITYPERPQPTRPDPGLTEVKNGIPPGSDDAAFLLSRLEEREWDAANRLVAALVAERAENKMLRAERDHFTTEAQTEFYRAEAERALSDALAEELALWRATGIDPRMGIRPTDWKWPQGDWRSARAVD